LVRCKAIYFYDGFSMGIMPRDDSANSVVHAQLSIKFFSRQQHQSFGSQVTSVCILF